MKRPMTRMIILAVLLTGCADNLTSAAQMTPPFDGEGAQAKQIWVSPDGPVSDINAALQMATPGTDVMVKAGTYQGAVKFARSGDDGAPIRLISADGRGKARIVSDKTGLYGFGTKNAGVFGFHIVAGSGGNGIQFGLSGSDTSAKSRYVRNLVIADNLVEDAGEDGIKLSQADGVFLYGNIVRNSGADRNGNGDGGIDMVAVNHSQIVANVVDGTPGHTCLMMKGGSEGNFVAGNIMKGCERDGLSVGGLTTGKWMRPGTDSEAKFNTVVGNDIEAGRNGLLIFGATGNMVANNRCGGRQSCVSEMVSDRGHTPMGNYDNRLENNRPDPAPDVGTSAVQGDDPHRWARAHKIDMLPDQALQDRAR
jgi:Right handed beta helix region